MLSLVIFLFALTPYRLEEAAKSRTKYVVIREQIMLVSHRWVVLTSAALMENWSGDGAGGQTIEVEPKSVKKLERALSPWAVLFV